MRILAFRHIPCEHLGLIEPELKSRGIGWDYADLCQPDAALPRPADYDGLIFMGGPMSVNDGLPCLEFEKRCIAQAVASGQPVLGVCLGAQLIASALGARVYRNPKKEIGWFDVHLTEAAQKDPLFAGAGPTETVFHWHGETFDLPEGSTWLAWSEDCRHQAFRLGAGTYGLQFHLEVTPGMIRDWCCEDANSGDVRELEAPIDALRNSARLAVLSQQVFGRWCGLLRTSP
jgi:GMP synthase-like glutamine amidotransferase